jgi:hypothetical protein
MPKNVRRFAWLWWTSNLLGACLVPFVMPTSPELTKAGFSSSFQMEIGFIGVAVFVAIMVPFFWLAVWRRKNRARWVLLVVFAALAITSLFAPDHIGNRFAEVANFASWLTLVASFFFLFTGDARPWFNRKLPQLDADVFL